MSATQETELEVLPQKTAIFAKTVTFNNQESDLEN